MSTNVTLICNTTDVSGSFGREFIARRLSDYCPPMRRGTARGVAIGMKREKFAAAVILAVYDLDSAEVARVIRMPVRLVSKWRTEAAFQAEVERLRRACCDELLSRITPGSAPVFTDVPLFSPMLKEDLLTACDRLAAAEDMRIFKLWPIVREFFRLAPTLRPSQQYPPRCGRGDHLPNSRLTAGKS